ncbi:MAG: methyltransferase domain-containing protein [Candidatus Omnitrophica bacterium]|nr:methyltransferase domain-containing protein [Candidatus Omnitrophota bacterium]
MSKTQYYDSTIESPPATMDQYYADVGERIIVREIRKYGKNLKVLDVGCGEGMLGSFLLDDNQVYGVEIFEEKVKRCCEKGINAKLVRDNDPIPYMDSCFDVVTCCQVLEHLLNPFYMVEEMHRVLKNDGLLVVTVPNIYDLITRVRFPFGIWTKIQFGANLGHIRFYSKKTLIKLIKEEGFVIQKCISYGFIVYLQKPVALLAYGLAFVVNPLWFVKNRGGLKLRKQQIYQNINIFLTKILGFTSFGADLMIIAKKQTKFSISV